MRYGLWVWRGVLLLVLIPSTASVASVAALRPPPEQPCEIIDRGLYVPEEQATRFADDGSVTGERFEIDAIRFTKRTTVIPAERGRGFGMRYRLTQLPTTRAFRVTWRITYPHRIHKLPGWEHSEVDTAPSGELVQHLLYDFVYDWEAVPGDWRFQVLVDGQPACTLTFQVK